MKNFKFEMSFLQEEENDKKKRQFNLSMEANLSGSNGAKKALDSTSESNNKQISQSTDMGHDIIKIGQPIEQIQVYAPDDDDLSRFGYDENYFQPEDITPNDN